MAIATLTVDMVARIGAFVASLKEAEGKADSTGRKLKKALTPDASVAKGFAVAGTAAVAALSAIAAGTALAISKGVEYSGTVVDLSERMGLTTESTQSLLGAMGQLGFSSSETISYMEKLQKAMVDAQDPSSKAAEAFKAVGLSADDLRNMSVDEVFRAVADGTSKMKDSIDRADVAMQLFGKTGGKLGEVLRDGTAPLDEAKKKFEDLGLILDDLTVRTANSVGDSFDLVGVALNSLSTQITSDMAPVINGLAQDFAAMVGEFIKSGDASRVVEIGLGVIDAAIGTVIVTVKTMQGVWYALQGVIQTVIGFVVNKVMSFVQTMGVLGDVISKLFSRDFSGAVSAAKSGWKTVVAADKAGMAEVLKNAQEYQKKSVAAFNAAGEQISGNGFSLGNYERKAYTPGESQGTQGRRASAGAGAAGGASKAAKELDKAAQAAQQLEDSYNSQLLSYEQAMYMLGRTGEEATISWEIAGGKFKKLGQAEKDILLEKARALDLAKKQQDELDRRKQDHERDLENAQRFTEELQFQMEIYGKTADEIERANLARDLGSALETEIGQKAQAALAAYQENKNAQDQQIEAMDALRNSARGFFSDVLSGSKSFKDALMGALDSFNAAILDMIAKNLVKKLLGEDGTSGGGSMGGFFSSIFGGMFGRATGGGVSSGSFHKINEGGPEILSVGGADYLMMGDQSGVVHPAGKSRTSSGNVINFAVQGKIDRRTQQQIANETSRQLSVAGSRS